MLPRTLKKISTVLIVVGCCVIATEVGYLHGGDVHADVVNGVPSVPPRPIRACGGGGHTLVVPTLETQLPEHGSAVWCSSLALAWGALRTKLAPGPIHVQGVESLTQALDKDVETASEEVPANCVYANAGLVRDGILKEIAQELAKQFPEAHPPQVSADADAVAYAYLHVAVSFGARFGESEAPLGWKDSKGRTSWVRSFGINRYNATDDMPEMLCATCDERGLDAELALDLAPAASPVQIVVARIPRGTSLGATLGALDQRIAAFGSATHIGRDTKLIVPRIGLDVHRDFAELEDRPVVGPLVPYPFMLKRATQSIALEMDETGVRITSEARIKGTLGHSLPPMAFDGPFLVLAKKRGAARPFFVLWVDDADLLAPS